MHAAVIGAIPVAIAIDVDERGGVAGVVRRVVIIAIPATVHAGFRGADEDESVIAEPVTIIIAALVDFGIAVVVDPITDLFGGGAAWRDGVVRHVVGHRPIGGEATIERRVLIREVATCERDATDDKKRETNHGDTPDHARSPSI